MTVRPPTTILLLTVLGFCTLYAPQPLLPVLAKEFGLGAGTVSLAITATLLPLAFAPLFYGYLLEGLPARAMLVAATGLLAAAQAALALASDWPLFLFWRLVEGLALPALFTALMTFVAGSVPREQVRSAMGWYIAATLVGGFGGRALSGLAAGWWDWRIALVLWTPLLVLMALAVLRLGGGERSHFARVTPRVFAQVLCISGVGSAYLAIFAVFFIFAALLNVLPFRMGTIEPGISATVIGFAYLGYLAGLFVSLRATHIRDALGSEGRVYLVGVTLYGSGLALFALPSIGGIYLAMFLFCGGMFLVHTRLSGEVNHLAHQHKGVVNGIYIAAYYFGGALGSWLPAELYRHLGWLPFLGLLGGMLLLAALSLWRLQYRTHPV